MIRRARDARLPYHAVWPHCLRRRFFLPIHTTIVEEHVRVQFARLVDVYLGEARLALLAYGNLTLGRVPRTRTSHAKNERLRRALNVHAQQQSDPGAPALVLLLDLNLDRDLASSLSARTAPCTFRPRRDHHSARCAFSAFSRPAACSICLSKLLKPGAVAGAGAGSDIP